MQYMAKVCPDCGGTGRIEATDTPMGVSQWKAHGIKYGYWDFFAKNPRTNDTEVSSQNGGSEQSSPVVLPNSTTEDIGEVDELMAILKQVAKDSWHDGINSEHLSPAHAALLRRAEALIAAHDRARLDAVLEAIGRDEENHQDPMSANGVAWRNVQEYIDARNAFRAELRPAVLAIFKMEDGK